MAGHAPWLGLDQNRNFLGERMEQDRRHVYGDPIRDKLFWDGQKWVFWFHDRWGYFDGQVVQTCSNEPVVLMELRSDLAEYRTVTEHFTSAAFFPHVFHRVFRIHNWTLWSRYSWKRTEMMEQRGGGTVKELMLFHGTPLNNIDSICTTGFDYGRCKHSTIGHGTYFARYSNMANVFTRRGTEGDRYPQVVQSALPHHPQPPGAWVPPASQGMSPPPVAQPWQHFPLPPALPPAPPQQPVGVRQQPPVGAAAPAAAPPPPPPQQPVGAVRQPQAGLAGFPGFHTGVPGFQTGVPGFHTGVPGFQTGVPGFHTGVPGFHAGAPGFHTGVPGFHAGVPGFHAGVPGFQTGAPGFQTGVPGFHMGVPGFQTGTPGFHTGVPGFHAGVPGFHTGVPGFHTGFPEFQTGVPEFQTGVPGFYAGVPGFHTGVPGFHTGFPEFQTGVPGFHAGVPGFHAGVPGALNPGDIAPVPGPQFLAGQPPSYYGGYDGAVNPAFVPQPVPSSFGMTPMSVMAPLPNPLKLVGVRYMFVVRVLVGRSKQGAKHIRQPPPEADSSVDKIPPEVYAIFNNSQSYPEYLLEYQITQ